MTRFFAFDFLPRLRKEYLHFLAGFWLFGFFLGILIFLRADHIPFLEMHSFLLSPVSIVGSLLASVFPFLIFTFAVVFSKPKTLLFIAFLRAFVLSYVCMYIISCFGSSGWLVQSFLFFGEASTVPLIYTFWPRILDHRRSGLWAFFCISISVLAAAIDYCVISPFLASLIEI